MTKKKDYIDYIMLVNRGGDERGGRYVGTDEHGDYMLVDDIGGAYWFAPGGMEPDAVVVALVADGIIDPAKDTVEVGEGYPPSEAEVIAWEPVDY